MKQSANLHTRKNNKRDPLKGAPGHAAAEQAVAPQFSGNTDTDEQDTEAAASEGTAQSGFVEDLVQKLGSVFGEESVQKWRDMLTASSADAQAAFYSILRESLPQLPEKISLDDLSKLTEWQPAKSVKKHPVASAATVAAGIGAFFLVREYLARNPKAFSNATESASAGIREVAKRAKAFAAKRGTSSGMKSETKQAAGKKRGSAKTTSAKGKKAAGGKTKSAGSAKASAKKSKSRKS